MNKTIAVDFGVTTTKLAFYDVSLNKIDLLKFGSDNRLYVPSLFYLNESKKRLAGIEAENFLKKDPDGFLKVPLKFNLPERSVRAVNREKATPSELLTLLFNYLKEQASQQPSLKSHEPFNLRITIPADFGPPEEDPLLQAAVNAGFSQNNVSFIKEPIAVVKAWLNESGSPEKYFVTLDCGGGSLDWACLKRDNNERWEIISDPPPGSNKKLCSGYIEDYIFDHLKETVENEDQDYLAENAFYVRYEIQKVIENGLKSGADGIVTINNKDFALSAAKISSIVQQRYVDQVIDSLNSYINKIKEKLEIECPRILLCGGNSGFQTLKDSLEEQFGSSVTWWDGNKNAAVIGALTPFKVNKNSKTVKSSEQESDLSTESNQNDDNQESPNQNDTQFNFTLEGLSSISIQQSRKKLLDQIK